MTGSFLKQEAELETARIAPSMNVFAQPTNVGNKSHRVQGPMSGSLGPLGDQQPSKKVALKKLKTNNEDYILMQNISNQLAQQIYHQSSGSNTS